ncbi:hypothetical protein [Streptacidiphilus cavernicola]|uniref:Uncharacterized protein n=1 Tax=Streptacidiphilus cavernicola TaxID=3342716 RepID=A0ABV6W4Y1_9ACTN
MSGRPLPYKDLLAAAQHATGYLWPVPGNESVTVLLVPLRMGAGPWMIERRGDGDDTVWTGTGWVNANRPVEDIYRWSLTDALRQIDGIVSAEAARHEGWKRARTVGGSVDEFLAEFAEVTPC